MNVAAVHQVLLHHCSEYDRKKIVLFAEECIQRFLGSSSLSGRKVLLKPNLISASGPPHAVTHPLFVAAVAAAFLDCGAQVRLGDSPALGSCARVCAKRGIAAAIKGMGVKVVEFTAVSSRRLQCGVDLPIAEEALNCDLLVGLPKVKAHNQMLVTLAGKNLFGVVKGVRKAMLHMSHGENHHDFAEILCELPQLLPPQLHLADGIVAMHESGPLDGSALPLYCMAAAISPVALDTSLLAVLDLCPHRSPLWWAAKERNLSGWDVRDLVYPGIRPDFFHGSGFLAPPLLDPIRFSPWRFMRGLLRRALLRLSSFAA
jgi:uncharacterized protein (DUF362 family)